MLARKDAWKRLNKGGITVAASKAATANAQAGGLPKAFDMAHPALIKPFALDASASAPSAGSRPFLWGLEVYFKAIRLAGLVENFITTDSDGFKEARHTGILSPMSPIFDQEPKIDQIADITREHVEDWIEAVGGALFDEFPYQGRLRRRMRLIHKRSRQG
jgi:hypothetical protein